MLNQNLTGRKVSGVFSDKPYTGVVVESIIEKDGGYNHIIKLDSPIVMQYDNPTQTKRNNRWVLHHVNYNVDNRPHSTEHSLTIEE